MKRLPSKAALSRLLVEFAERGGCKAMREEMLDFARFVLRRVGGGKRRKAAMEVRA